MVVSKQRRLIFLASLTVLCICGAFFIKPIPQSLAYHHFADDREFWGIPNFANVISNLPFLLTGVIGLMLLPKAKANKAILVTYSCLFIGILLTGFGSAYYHYAPDNNTLVYDRIPMTIVFMALLAATIGETISAKWGSVLLFPLVIIGIGSVFYWHFTELQGDGDLRLYGLVQFYPVICIPLMLVLFPSANHNRGIRQLVWVVVWYVIAKIFEYFDWQIYAVTHFVSGHTLKHLGAAVSTWYLVRVFKIKHIQG